MRKLVARVFDYSLDGVIATEGTEFVQICRDRPDDPADDVRGSEFYAGADMHIMGRVAYQSMSGILPRRHRRSQRRRPQRLPQGGVLPARSRSPTGSQYHDRQR